MAVQMFVNPASWWWYRANVRCIVNVAHWIWRKEISPNRRRQGLHPHSVIIQYQDAH